MMFVSCIKHYRNEIRNIFGSIRASDENSPASTAREKRSLFLIARTSRASASLATTSRFLWELGLKVSIRYYTEVALTKLVEVKIIVTSINHLINPVRKNNPFHANMFN
jgi:hypothetical protein